MNKKLDDVCKLVGQLTLIDMPAAQINLELSRLSDARKKRIRERMWEFASTLNSNEYSPDQGFLILATYAAAIADDFNTNANTILIVMLTGRS